VSDADGSLLTLGVEEEYQIVDAATGELLPAAEAVLERARTSLGDAAQHELHRSQVEGGTPVCSTLAEVRTELVRMRRALLGAARDAGCRILAAGTHPISSWRTQEVTPTERYLWLAAEHRRVARETLIFGCHVHVACGDPETTIEVVNRSRPWLPALLALSVNSPFWEGRDTGFSSYRTLVFRRWPTAGAPLPFSGRAEYDRLVGALTRVGAISDPTRLYWDVRPSHRYPTVEFRVSDVCSRIDEAVMIAGLSRAVARTARDEHASGQPVEHVRPELLEAAIWLAARDGLEAELIDPLSARREPAAALVERLLDHVRPALEEHGDVEEVTGLVQETLSAGTGATRQRAALRRRGRISDVVELLLEESEAGLS
jgi:glutamate---cysteine ligase / carboxylate-amine ligase